MAAPSLREAPEGERATQHVPTQTLDRDALMGLEGDVGVEVEGVAFGGQRRRRRLRGLGAEELEPRGPA